ncbi:class I SAM-dependent methyltransferase [Candidatus Omnitrophota bacterium]
MSTQIPSVNQQVEFWNSLMHPEKYTAGELDPGEFDLEKNLEFYRTPAQKYAYGRLGNITGKDVLELGCGMGLNAMIMARAGACVTAIDIAQKRVDWVNNLAQKYGLKNLKAVCMSAEELEFADESFDVIYSNEVLIHTDRQKALAEAQRVLRKGAQAIFIESLKYNPLVNLYRYTLGPKIFKRIANHFSLKELKLFRANFDQVEHQEFYFLAFLAFFWQYGIQNLRMFRISLALLNRIDEFIFRYFTFMRRFGWMSCIECIKGE